MVTGKLDAFSPTQGTLSLTSADGTREEPSDAVAWIAFRTAAAAPAAGAEGFRVHVAGGPVLNVRVRPDDVRSELGFYAAPAGKDDKVAELFVYAHAVNGTERDVPLGAMLIAEGLLDPDAVSRGVAAQSNGRRLPIGEILVSMKRVDAEAVESALATQRHSKLRLGDVLVEAGFASAADIELAMAEQRRRQGKRLGEVLVEIGILSEQDLARALAAKFQLPLVNLDEVEVNASALAEVPAEIVGKYGVLPIDVDAKVLTVAIADPLATDAIDMLRFQCRRRVRVVLATQSQLRSALEDAHYTRALLVAQPPSTPAPVVHAGYDYRDDDVVRMVNQLILSSAQRGASDIHIEPHGDDRPVRVRVRIDGRCVNAPDIPGRHRSALVNRVKILASLDIADRRRPQDGKLKVVGDNNKSIDIRVTTVPTIEDNEDVVLRILTASRRLGFEDLQLSPHNADVVQSWMRLDHGLILCVGPTGVGKTTTVHAMLGMLNTDELKVWTAEDPVEIVGAGLRQVHVQPKIDLTFANALRTFLRADPDVIMVGEMRDRETAALAVEASLTGHLVLSTLHTKSAADTIGRLLDMGLDPLTVADALSGVVSQRLVRRLCDTCKTHDVASRDEIASLERVFGEDVVAQARATIGEPVRLWRASACDACAGSGYAGRIALTEVLTVDDRVRAMIARRATTDELRGVAQEGCVSLKGDGLAKALAGYTDVLEVIAVTGG